MSTKLPRITCSEAIKAFAKAGFFLVRTSGSHCVLKKEGHRYLLTIPDHGSKTLGLGLLRNQIDVAGLTVQEFCDLLE